MKNVEGECIDNNLKNYCNKLNSTEKTAKKELDQLGRGRENLKTVDMSYSAITRSGKAECPEFDLGPQIHMMDDCRSEKL